MYHATYLECKMLPAYPLSNIWPAGEHPVVLPVYTQDTSPDMMMDNEGSPYMPGAPGTDDLLKAIVGKAIVEKAIVRKKRDAEEAPEGHESKRLVTDEMNMHMLSAMEEVD